MVRPTVPVTDLRALRYICRGPCGARKEPNPSRQGRIDSPMEVKTKGDKD